jgi:hypothetical protein
MPPRSKEREEGGREGAGREGGNAMMFGGKEGERARRR